MIQLLRGFAFVWALTLGFVPSAFAKRIDIKWDSIVGAEKYEYQLSRTESFGGDLVRSGSTQNIYFVTDLGPGIYFLRVRGIAEGGRAGAWSQGTRLVVEAAELQIKKPSVGEVIEISSETSPFLAEWTAIEGADDYQVQVKLGKELRTIISPTNSVRLEGLKAGDWRINIQARAAGQVVQRSIEVAFKIKINPKPKPVIYSPISGESTVAWDHFTIRWLNNSVSPKSEVVIRRMGKDTGVISREIVYGKAETLTPKLPPGAYQITVKNIYENMTSEAAAIDISAVEDAMGYHAHYFGMTADFVLGPTYGSTGFQKDTYRSGERSGQRNASGEIDMRLIAEVSAKWGFEIGGGARGDRFIDRLEVSNADGFISVESSRLQPHAFVGARYKLEPIGPSKPLWVRSWLFWRQIEMPTKGLGGPYDNTTAEPKMNISNARVLGTGFGAEMRWGGYRSRWDVVGRADLTIPWIGKGMKLATAGVSPMWPGLELRITPRVKIASDMRMGIVLGGRLEALTLKEKVGDNSKYISRRIFFMPTLSWDL